MKLALSTLLAAATFASICAIALACAHDASPPRPLEASSPALSPPAPAPASAETCLEVNPESGGKPTTLEGRVITDPTFAHPTRGRTRPFILRLATSRCAIGIDEPRVVEVHLAPTDSVTLKPLVGQRVRVSGEPFMAHTAWHARPIVVLRE